jgi:Family of unknown function (DUF6182)
MKLTQDFLRDQHLLRIARARPELAGPGARPGLDVDAEDGEVMVVCVVRRFDLAPWIRGTCRFAFGLAPDQAKAWRRSFTKTAFLAGNPGNLAHRFRFAHVSEDRATAWTPPSHAEGQATLRRLLKLFHGPRVLPPRPAFTVAIPGGGDEGRAPARRVLYISTAGVTFGDCLITLNHLLAEAVMDGLLTPGALLTVRQVPRLAGIPEPMDAMRIAPDPDAPDRLRAFAALTKEYAVA